MINSSHSQRRKTENDRAAPIRLYFLFILLLALLWLAFSGKFDLLHLSYGVLSIALVFCSPATYSPVGELRFPMRCFRVCTWAAR